MGCVVVKVDALGGFVPCMGAFDFVSGGMPSMVRVFI